MSRTVHAAEGLSLPCILLFAFCCLQVNHVWLVDLIIRIADDLSEIVRDISLYAP
jgi:hypothetical protein